MKTATILSLIALLLATAALVVSVTSIRQVDEPHKCGSAGADLVSCLPGSTPEHRVERDCFPLQGRGGVVYWRCNE
jgi:hypothetical protein